MAAALNAAIAMLRANSGETALFLDCDGVLAPIVAHAGSAEVPVAIQLQVRMPAVAVAT